MDRTVRSDFSLNSGSLPGPFQEGQLPIPRDGLDGAHFVEWARGSVCWASIRFGDDRDGRPGTSSCEPRGCSSAWSQKHLERWPRSTHVWDDALPAEVLRRRDRSVAPDAAVLWTDTRRLGPWPPREFILRPSSRVADTMLVTTLRWTIDELLRACDLARRAEPSCVDPFLPQLEVARRLLDRSPLREAHRLLRARPPLNGPLARRKSMERSRAGSGSTSGIHSFSVETRL